MLHEWKNNNNNTGYIRLHVTNAYMCTKNPCSGLLCRTLLASDCRPETVLMLLGHLRVVGLRPRVMAHPTQAGSVETTRGPGRLGVQGTEVVVWESCTTALGIRG